MINLYSDTQTLPTDEMLEAMTRAPLGDDVLEADPTVRELEERAATLFGKEAGLLVPSGTMANLVSLFAHRRAADDEVFLDRGAHVYEHEAGGLCSLAGYVPRFVGECRGLIEPGALREAIRCEDVHFPTPRLLWLENTHCCGGGRVLSPERQRELVAIAREHGLSVHVDGARIFNAAVKLGVPVSELVADVDSSGFCLSKGLSCPVGSVVVGSVDFVHRARRARKRLGGGMRQAGVIAACGLVALRSNIDRLAEDHTNARALALALDALPGISVDVSKTETNMCFVDVGGLGIDCFEAQRRLEQSGVLVSEMWGAIIRIVTHRLFAASDIPAVVEAFDILVKGAD